MNNFWPTPSPIVTCFITKAFFRLKIIDPLPLWSWRHLWTTPNFFEFAVNWGLIIWTLRIIRPLTACLITRVLISYGPTWLSLTVCTTRSRCLDGPNPLRSQVLPREGYLVLLKLRLVWDYPVAILVQKFYPILSKLGLFFYRMVTWGMEGA